jgi:hypothetical protein
LDYLHILENIPNSAPAIPYLTAAIAVAAALATVLPPPTAKSGAYPVLYSFVNWVALNFGHATNAADAPTTSSGEGH